ncbi:MAG TPA: crossover junction endodeoxyribonuclease RuvC [Candidatus Limadaptatus stercoripullorum]|uniref:Crossover junction endodeoxyribonuclease RuvC n=1 Tax=Candidatus Limadaptatus stercoripullorum TaxID=2840846 RepID=A0A9D1SWA4_9FIRM|nr:crossover junction endodeoxyribonuclease RuvC [Candidatus Limadaptatus stercoripullorum]
MIILGIDPGIATLGYGVLLAEGGRFSAVDYGVVTTPKGTPLPERLEKLEEGVAALFDRFTPDEVAVEELFFTKNITNGIMVAEARGVVLLTARRRVGDNIFEYTPNQIKMALTGYGGAQKKQMQMMVQALLKLKSLPRPDDAADALAVALCHGHASRLRTQFRIK